MLATSLFCHINELALSLGQQNEHDSVQEFEQLLGVCGQGKNEVEMAKCLASKFDVTGQSSLDPLQQKLLQKELKWVTTEPNLVTIVCQALVPLLTSYRTENHAENFLAGFCTSLAPDKPQLIALALALVESDNGYVQSEAEQFLKTVLMQEWGSGTKGQLLPHRTFVALLLHLSTSPAFAQTVSSGIVEALREAHTDLIAGEFKQEEIGIGGIAQLNNLNDCAVIEKALGGGSRKLIASGMVDIADSIGSSGNLAGFLADLGPAVTDSVPVLRQTVEESGIVVDEEQIAQLLAMLVVSVGNTSTTTSSSEENYDNSGGDSSLSTALTSSLLASGGSGGFDLQGEEGGTSWNIGVVKQYLASDYEGKIDWVAVVRHLDFPGFLIPDEKSLALLLELYRGASHSDLPLDVICGPWYNTRGQLSLLSALVAAPPEMFSFNVSQKRVPLLEGMDTHMITPNEAWLSLELLEALLRATSSDLELYATVKDLLSNPMLQCPELLAAGLVSIPRDSEALKGPGGRLRMELLSRLLPPFFRPNRSAATPALVRSLFLSNPSLVVQSCVDAYSVDASLPSLLGIARVVRLVPEARPLILSHSKHSFAIAMASILFGLQVAGTPPESQLDLEAWAKERLAAPGGDVFLQRLTAFVNRHMREAAARAFCQKDLPNPVEGAEVMVTCLMTLEAMAAFLRAVAAASSEDQVPHLMHLLELAKQLQPSLLPMLQQQVPLVPLASASSQTPVSGPTGSGSGPSSLMAGGGGSRVADSEVEDAANTIFTQLYSSEKSVQEVVERLEHLRACGDSHEQCVFACVVHSLFDESRYFYKYPEAELQSTSMLFGQIIQRQLISGTTLVIALRYVLEGLRSRPGPGSSGKVFRFGMIALKQFMSRLSEWPQYCSHIMHIPHIVSDYADIAADVESAMRSGIQFAQSGGGSHVGNPGDVEDAALAPLLSQPSQKQPQQPEQSFVMSSSMPSVPLTSPPALTTPDIDAIMMDQSHDVDKLMAPPENVMDRIHFIINNISQKNLDQKIGEMKDQVHGHPEYTMWISHYLVVKRISSQPNFHSIYLQFIDRLDEDVVGFVAAILKCTYHNIGQLLRSRNIITSTRDRSLLKNLGSWLGQITLAWNKPVLQRQLDLKELLFQGYETGCLIAVTPFVAKILEGAQYSTVFLPPNPWTMALLSALHDMYDLEDLKMNIKFEIEMLVKILDLRLEDVPKFGRLSSRRAPQKEKNSDFNVKDKQSMNSPASLLSPVRRPPTTAGSSIGGPAVHLKGGELHSQHQFTPVNSSAAVGTGGASASHHQQPSPALLPRGVIQMPESALQSSDLSTSAIPQTIGGSLLPPAVAPNSSMKSSSPHLQAGTSTSSVKASPSSAALPEQETVIPNLAAYVTISNTLQIFITQPGLKQLVPVAVDCAIREIVQPVVERSVTIACITTRELIMKDFAVEQDESKIRKAAHLMVTSLAGSLALVTCKEPLRMSISTHLRQLLNTHAPEWAGQAVDAVVMSCSSDNLELGCMLIEKAAMEKAVRDIDELLASAVSSKRKQLQDSGAVTGQQNLYDPTSRTFKAHQQQQLQYLSMLPKPLRPRPEGLTPPQLMVYEAFQHMAHPPSTMSSRQQQASSSATSSAYDQSQQQQQQQGKLTVSEALAAWQVAMHHLDMALQQLLMQAAASGRPGELSLSMVGIDTELSSALHEVMGISQRVPANLREGALLKFSQSVFRTLFKNTETESAVEVPLLRVEVYVAVLELCLRDLKQVLKDEVVTAWYTSRLVGPMVGEGERKLQKAALTMLIRAKMIRLPELDHHIASNMANPPSSQSATPERAAISWAEFGLSLIRQCVFDHTTQVAVGLSPKAIISKFTHTLDQLSRVAQLHAGFARQFDKLMIDLQEAGQATGGDVQGGTSFSRPQQAGPLPVGSDSSLSSGPPSVSSIPPASSMSLSGGSPPAFAALAAADAQRGKQAVTSLLEYWLRICQERSHDEKALSQYIQLLQQQGVVATDESTECFLRIVTDLVIDACLKSASSHSTFQDKEMDSAGGFDNLGGNTTTLSYSIVDAYSNLLILLMKGSPEPAAIVRVSVLNKVLGTLARCLLVDYEAKHATKTFDQRPHYRLLVNLVQDLCGLDQQLLETTQLQVLGGLASAFHMLQPSVVPGFVFAWLGLTSHRAFMPTLLQAKQHKGWPYMHQLLVDLFAYAEPLLSSSKLSTPGLKLLYKSILRIMVVLLHDFPEFLCEYHLSFCSILPPNCIQLRNLVLSAFPRNVHLPDVLTTNLKADLLVEISQPPRILSNYAAVLNHLNIRGPLDKYIVTGTPQQFLEELPAMLRDDSGASGSGKSKYNAMAINALVVYVGSQAIFQRQSKSQKILQTTPVDVFKSLAYALDMEGRYIFLNSIANQLRYPNNHTHYFSRILLYMFEEATIDVVQEQITRILLERLIVHRPHPWGLLITFIELIKNPRYNFWKHKFTKLAPELEEAFASVARSCMAGGVAGDGGDVSNSAAAC